MEKHSECNRGSEWRKWDLQVQPIKNGWFIDLQKNLDSINNATEKYIDIAIEKGIEVIAITDHNTGIAIDHAINYSKDKNMTILSGVELDANSGEHIIVIFNPEYKRRIKKDTWAEVVESFLLSKCKIDHPFHENAVARKVGITTEELIKIVNAENLGIFIFAHCTSDDGFMQRSGDKDKRKTIASSFFKENHQFIFEVKETEKVEEVKSKLKGWQLDDSKFPVIASSDANQANDVGKYFTWIKADRTFDGLKQIIYEPIERIRIQDTKPDDKFGYNIIDSIQFINGTDNKFTTQRIYLNPNLNTIIGGKSTGKSNLLRKMAKEIDLEEFKKEEKDIVSWIKQNITVKWQSGDDSQKKILYIPQSYLIKDFESGRKNIEEIIETSLKGDINTKQLYNQLESDKNKIKMSINSLSDQLLENGRIENGRVDEIKNIGNREGLKIEIQKLQENKTTLLKELKIEDKEIEEYNTNNEKITNNKKTIDSKIKDISILDLKITLIESREYKEFIDNDDFFSDEVIKKEINEKYNSLIIEAYNKIRNEIVSQKKILNDGVNTLIKRNEELEKINEPIQDKLKKQSTLHELTKKIEEEQRKLTQVDELERIIKNKQAISRDLINKIFVEFDKYYSIKTDFINNFYFNEDGLNIGYKLRFNKESIYEWLSWHVVNNKTSYLSKINDKYKTYKFDNDYSTFRDTINFFFKEVVESKIPFKGDFNKDKCIKSLLGDWFELEPVMEYDGDKIEHMSDGKKAFVLLKLLVNIDNSKYPILLDQPEDSLDNRSIYNELTTYIKEKKKHRQIIIVTHNANLVVGADAENIIVANQHGIKTENKDNVQFDYVNGALEQSRAFDKTIKIELEKRGIKEHVCEILEGGDEAFIKREKKYGIKY
jgi:hypothetical protein